MKTRYWLVAGGVVFLFFASGCAGISDKSKLVMLQNPETMEFVKCTVDTWGTRADYAKNEKCVEEYKRQGYVIWSEY